MKLYNFIAAVSFSTFAALAQAVTLPGSVVDAEWLAKNKSEVQIVEVTSDVASFLRNPEIETDIKTGKKVLAEVGGHIEGSALLDFTKIRAERMIEQKKVKYLIPEKADFEKLVQTAGINAGKPIVLVPIGLDIADVDEALRVLWQFKVYGERNIAVLDGGLAGWLMDGKAVSTEGGNLKAGNWQARDYRKELVASSDEVDMASKSGKTELIDSRPPSQYFGVTKRDYVSGYGHIAGAKDFAPELLTRAKNGALYFLNKNTYEALLTASGINPTAPAISYCNSGHFAAGSWFVVNEIIGNKAVKLYDGSLHLWTIEGRPLVSVPL
jgi:thiosulfate/3-mercaptopyruvate sulfurtransferase